MIPGEHRAGAADRPGADANHPGLYWLREGGGGQAPHWRQQVAINKIREIAKVTIYLK